MRKNIIIMGVSGCGKTTIGEMLAEKISASFYDGDDFHPQANVDKMASGTPLTDEDRQPWLEKLAVMISEQADSTVTACSALKGKYRDTLRSGGEVIFVYLHGERETLINRINERSLLTDHFMSSDLLDSQLATLEVPTEEVDCITVGIEDSPEVIVNNIIKEI